MKAFSFVFAGSSSFSLKLLSLLQKSKFFHLKGLVAVPPAVQGRGMKKQASRAGLFAAREKIPLQEPEDLSDRAFIERLKNYGADFLLVCSYGKILPFEILSLFPRRAFNLHLSLLPLWRGAAPVQRALMAGDSQSGVCLQLMAEELDAGDIVGQRAFALTQNDNTEDVYNKALGHCPSLLSLELRDFLEGRLKPRPQDHTKKTYARKIRKKEAKIVWNRPARDIHNQIRALFSGPQAFSFFKGRRIKIFRSLMAEGRAEGRAEERAKGDLPSEGLSPGRLFVTGNQLWTACAPGALRLLELQKEGKKRIPAEDFLKGQSFAPGGQWEE